MTTGNDKDLCVCGMPADRGQVAVHGLVRVCSSGEHVVVGFEEDARRIYVYVENPQDVIEVPS